MASPAVRLFCHMVGCTRGCRPTLRSKREMISPTKPRCTPSGFTMTYEISARTATARCALQFSNATAIRPACLQAPCNCRLCHALAL